MDGLDSIGLASLQEDGIRTQSTTEEDLTKAQGEDLCLQANERDPQKKPTC